MPRGKTECIVVKQINGTWSLKARVGQGDWRWVSLDNETRNGVIFLANCFGFTINEQLSDKE